MIKILQIAELNTFIYEDHEIIYNLFQKYYDMNETYYEYYPNIVSSYELLFHNRYVYFIKSENDIIRNILDKYGLDLSENVLLIKF